MEAGRSLLSSSPPFAPRTHLRNCPSTSSSVLMLHEQPAPAVTYMPANSSARYFPTSVLLQEQRDESRPSLHMQKEHRAPQVMLDRKQTETGSSVDEEQDSVNSHQYFRDFQQQLLKWPVLCHLMPSLQSEDTPSSLVHSVLNKTNNLMDVEPLNAVALAKKALTASKRAALLSNNSQLFGPNLNDSLSSSSNSTSLVKSPNEEVKTVRSTRLIERQSKQRRVEKQKVTVHETRRSRRPDFQRKMSESFDPNDPLRLFLRGPEMRQLLTAKEESELIDKIQNLMTLEEVKRRLQSQFDREPTVVEWAEAVGLSCRALQSQLHCGTSSREKLIYANFRMVVHIAKQYQGHGLNLQDLLQEGSMGLMKSVEKFKPQAGCRFASYAYWWIRQAVRKAIFQHSRTIRLPDNIYSLLHKVTEAKRSCIQEGNHQPTKDEIAARIGITVEKLERLLLYSKMPLSLQQPVWTDQDTTFQEITADCTIEIPDVSVSKQLMRQHIHNLLSILSPKERKIIRLRFGIGDGIPKSLSEIGAVFRLSKERVRQLESRALYKLRQGLDSRGLDAYACLLA